MLFSTSHRRIPQFQYTTNVNPSPPGRGWRAAPGEGRANLPKSRRPTATPGRLRATQPRLTTTVDLSHPNGPTPRAASGLVSLHRRRAATRRCPRLDASSPRRKASLSLPRCVVASSQRVAERVSVRRRKRHIATLPHLFEGIESSRCGAPPSHCDAGYVNLRRRSVSPRRPVAPVRRRDELLSSLRLSVGRRRPRRRAARQRG